MSIAMMKGREIVRPQPGSNDWMGGKSFCYKDRRANAPKLLKCQMSTIMNSIANWLVFCDLNVCSPESVVRSLYSDSYRSADAIYRG